MSSNILTTRDTNAQPKPSPSPEKQKPKTMEYHRQILESKLKNGQEEHTYISPSDQIMSPATQKLNAFRNKHAMKKSKPQTLFARTSSKNLQKANGGSMFGDMPNDDTTTKDNTGSA